MFGLILISVITLLHVYVIWRITSVPFLKRLFPAKYIIDFGLLLWALFCAGILYGHHGANNLARVLEFVGMNWMATLFLVFVLLLLVECISGFGFLLPRLAPSLRGLALIAGGLL